MIYIIRTVRTNMNKYRVFYLITVYLSRLLKIKDTYNTYTPVSFLSFSPPRSLTAPRREDRTEIASERRGRIKEGGSGESRGKLILLRFALFYFLFRSRFFFLLKIGRYVQSVVTVRASLLSYVVELSVK